MATQGTLFSFFGKAKGDADAAAIMRSPSASPLQSPRVQQQKQQTTKAGARKAAPTPSSSSAGDAKRARTESEPAPQRSRRAPAPAAAPLAAPSLTGGEAFLHLQLPFLNEDLRDASGTRYDEEGYDPTTLRVPTQLNGVRLEKHPKFKPLFTEGGQQWWGIKKRNFDAVLLFKQGKFYEMFNMDAEVGVRELGLKWMGDPSKGGKAHAGFPEQSYHRYAQQLVDRNYRVIRIEQTETPAQMQARLGKKTGTLRREAVQFLSAGTNFSADDDMMKDHTPKCLLCLVERRADGGEERAALADNAVSYGVCILDPSTASFEVGSFGEDMYQTRLGTLLSQLQPAEILFAAQSLGADTKTTIDRESDKALMSPQPPSEAWDAQRTLRELASGGYFRDKEDDAMETEGDDSEGAWPRVIGEFAARVRGAEAEEGDPHADLALRALGACVKYLQAQLIDQEMVALQNFHRFLPYDAAGSGASAAATEEGAERARAPAQLRSVRGARRMVLDTNSIANLELLENEQGLKQHSLLAFLDRCSTNSGKRLLKKWLLSPLYHKDEIDRRLDAVEELLGLGEVIEQAVAPLRKLPDFERLLGRVHANARRDPAHPMNRAIIYEDLSKKRITALRLVLDGFRSAQRIVSNFAKRAKKRHGTAVKSALLRQLLGLEDGSGAGGGGAGHFPDLLPVLEQFDAMFDLADDVVKPRPGCDPVYDEALEEIGQIEERLEEELDTIRDEYFDGDREVKYFHTTTCRYQVEVPQRLAGRVPSSYKLKSQVKAKKSACQRFHTPRVENLMQELDEAEDARDDKMKCMLQKVCQRICAEYPLFARASGCLATLDVLFSLADVSRAGCGSLPMCRPTIVDAVGGEGGGQTAFEMEGAWHPILASNIDSFIANDTTIGGTRPPCLILTGPNMGGKSTLLRQTAIATIMAQLGCYVPASRVALSPVDRIFTRMGARDNIMMGQSTFMIEMHEAAIVLRHASAHSLVLMDELGRGTSTFDGVAIAYGTAKALAHSILCRSMFTTHYHTLMPDFATDDGMAIAHMGCLADEGSTTQGQGESNNYDITFLYRLTDGPVDKSYGMHVAKLAGLSQELVRRAEAKSRELEASQKAVFARNLFARLSSLLSKAEAEAGQSGEVWQQVLADLASAKQQAHGSLA